MNRYYIELQREGETEWRFVSECAEGMVLPEMVLQALGVLTMTEGAAVRVQCHSERTAISGPQTIHLVEARDREAELTRWTEKLERYQASETVESPA